MRMIEDDGEGTVWRGRRKRKREEMDYGTADIR